jgi:hypothetical protein
MAPDTLKNCGAFIFSVKAILGLLEPYEESTTVLQMVAKYSPNKTAAHPRRPVPSYITLHK